LLMISRQRESLETGSGGEKRDLVENQRDLVDKGSLGPGLEARERQLMMMREKQNLMMKAMERQVVEARGKERYDLGEGNEKSKAIKMEAVDREAISKDESALAQNNSHFNNESMSDNDEQYVLRNQTSAKKNIKEEVEENLGDKTVSSSETDLQGSFSKGPSRAETTMDCEICHINILKKSMPKHMQRKHANTFKCHICNKDFANLDGLKLHTLKNHQLANDEADTTQLINGLQAILNDDNIKNENRFEEDPLNHDDSLNSNNSVENSSDQTSIAKVTYDCDQCPTKFTHKDSVRRHKRRLHAS